ncbi:MAG: hypothetical protein JST86_15665 [Bacteroidetes bacterium]|nr:hypothetical protein [Bacteroidota bacterium]
MHTVEWYSEKIIEKLSIDLRLRNLEGRKYIFKCNDETGYVTYNDADFDPHYKTIVGYGRFRDIELIIRSETYQSVKSLVIYNKDQSEQIGILSPVFIYRNMKLKTYIKLKEQFQATNGNDMVFDIYTGKSNTIISIAVNKIEKKGWFQSVAFKEIHGHFTLPENPNWEFVITMFFALHDRLQLYRKWTD